MYDFVLGTTGHIRFLDKSIFSQHTYFLNNVYVFMTLREKVYIWLIKFIGVQGKRFTQCNGQRLTEKAVLATHAASSLLPSTHLYYQLSSS